MAKTMKKNPPRKQVLLMNVCSVKGGVGKTTLALMCGARLAALGVPTWVFDLDFTGTNLAQALSTYGLKPGPNSQNQGRYINDYLTIPPTSNTEEVFNKIQWRFPSKHGLAKLILLPSSVDDTGRRMLEPLLTSEHWTAYLRTRLLRIAETCLSNLPVNNTHAVMIFDHAPGVHDLSLEFVDPECSPLRIIEKAIPGREVVLRHLLVSSGDAADLTALGNFYNDHMNLVEKGLEDQQAKRFNLVLNRLYGKPNNIKYSKAAVAAFGPAWDYVRPPIGNGIDHIYHDTKFLFLHAVRDDSVASLGDLNEMAKKALPQFWASLKTDWVGPWS